MLNDFSAKLRLMAENSPPQNLDRRKFLKGLLPLAGGALLAACNPNTQQPAPGSKEALHKFETQIAKHEEKGGYETAEALLQMTQVAKSQQTTLERTDLSEKLQVWYDRRIEVLSPEYAEKIYAYAEWLGLSRDEAKFQMSNMYVVPSSELPSICKNSDETVIAGGCTKYHGVMYIDAASIQGGVTEELEAVLYHEFIHGYAAGLLPSYNSPDEVTLDGAPDYQDNAVYMWPNKNLMIMGIRENLPCLFEGKNSIQERVAYALQIAYTTTKLKRAFNWEAYPVANGFRKLPGFDHLIDYVSGENHDNRFQLLQDLRNPNARSAFDALASGMNMSPEDLVAQIVTANEWIAQPSLWPPGVTDVEEALQIIFYQRVNPPVRP